MFPWPYAAKAVIQHEFDTDHLNIWLTFPLEMDQLGMPPLEKWLVYANSVLKAVSASAWQDGYTLLLTVPDVTANPARVLVKYNGPDQNLCRHWRATLDVNPDERGKQWEPWGPILSINAAWPFFKNYFPRRATMWRDEATVVIGNPIRTDVYAPQNYNYLVYQAPPANGDTFTNSFFIKAGTYEFYVLAYTDPSAGKIDWYIDNVLVVSGQDWYSAVLTLNVIKAATGIVIPKDGYHVLKGVTNGHNASSLDYYIGALKYWLKPATDPPRE